MSLNNQYRLDYYTPDGLTQKTRYVGTAPPGVVDDEDRWVIYRFNHDSATLSLLDIHKATSVAWTERNALAWT